MKSLEQQVQLKQQWTYKLEFVFIFILFITILGAYLVVSKTKYRLKDTAVKKNEIIEKYELSLKNILDKYQEDKNKQLEEKKIFLKQCNCELSRNIFFTDDEASKVLQRLAKL
ncbi:MAG: hypothetical protein U9N59_03330 [Campylobacterota bacterium]|nr:hypothetical protein [Campylobacterota bacterium]